MTNDTTSSTRDAKSAISHRRDWLLEEWLPGVPWLRMPWGREWSVPDIRVDELRDKDDWVVRAELPGIDPERDLEVTIHNGVLTIQGDRREEERSEEEGYIRREIRMGSFRRTLPLPPGVHEGDIHASYEDGILEVRVPSATTDKVTKVAVTKG